MENFEFYTPTRMIFGRDTHLQVGKIIGEYGFQKVLVHFAEPVRKNPGFWMQCLRHLRKRESDM